MARQDTAAILRSELAEIAKKCSGSILQYKDYKRLGGTYARTTFNNHFGTWRKAVASIGLKDGYSRPRPDLRHFADEDYFAEMARVWDMFGRQPSVKEMRRHGRISPQAFQVRFGSWLVAVAAFKKFHHRSSKDLRIPEEISATSVYHEGGVERILVNRYERDPIARQKCIEHFGTTCIVCGFDFVATYGAFMIGFIHVHHLKSLASLGGDYEVDPVRDLRPVCPNCHAVLHRREPPYSLDEVRVFLQ